MSKNSLIRKKLKEEYKRMMKNVPKKQRPPFNKVFQQIKMNSVMGTQDVKTLPTGEVVGPTVEDVDMSELDDIFVEVEEGSDEATED